MNITRRDTIILATLCNIVVIAILFISGSVGSKNILVMEEGKKISSKPLQVVSDLPSNSALAVVETPIEDTSSDAHVLSFDEIDQLLEEYIGTTPEITPKKEKEIVQQSQKREQPAQVPVQKQAIKPSTAPTSKETSSKIDRIYIVQQGDNPWTIAKKCKISVEMLLKLNKLDEAKAKNLKIGQKLIIAVDDAGDEDLNRAPQAVHRFGMVP